MNKRERRKNNERVCVSVFERESVCVCERERERECVCVSSAGKIVIRRVM